MHQSLQRVAILFLTLGTVSPAVVTAQLPTELEFLGVATLASEPFEETEMGGLSALAFDSELGHYYTLSDDPSLRSPSRFYTLEVDLSSGRLEPDGARIVAVTTLTDRRGRPFGERIIDGEGLALTSNRTLLVSSEGNVRNGVPPSIREVGLDGRELREYRLPKRWLPAKGRGVRHNHAFEALTTIPGDETVVTATENALLQDGPDTDVDQGSRVRISRLDRLTGKLLSDFVYTVDPVVDTPATPDLFRTNGLVDVLALNRETYLAVERSFTVGAGNAIRLYLVSTEGAQDVRSIKSLEGRNDIREVSKRLLVDLTDLGIYLDNIEGMAFGPLLEDGRRSLLMVSDDNFNELQVTQVLAFAVGSAEISIAAIQGAAHRSPLEGRFVQEAAGVVTATDLDGRRRGFWMQSLTPDDSLLTAEGLFVGLGERDDRVEVGDLVAVDGRITESGREGELPVTRIEAYRVETVDSDQPLPPATPLISVPSTIDDDGLEAFEPEDDAIDLYESLEGMRIEVPEATITGPTTRFGTLTLAIGDSGIRTERGGLLLTADNPNSNRLVVDGSLTEGLPDVGVGRRLAAPSTGVLDYAFGHYRLVATESVEIRERDPAPLNDSFVILADCLNVASFNVENLDFGDSDDKFRQIAGITMLQHPVLVALQEIQDDSGREDDGTVSAKATLGRLLESVRALHGPNYAYVQVDPDNNADGGAPGGNIRVAFLYDPESVRLLRHERLFADHPAFLEDAETGYEATRKPLLAEFEHAGQRVVAINVHLKSKRGDDRTFGPRQPPVRATETQRGDQARALRDYVEGLLDSDPEARVLVLGDFNEHEFRAPMQLLQSSRLTNLIYRLPENERYTYNFEGNSQSLDHILASPALMTLEPTLEILRANANGAHSWRSSDHEFVYASFCPASSVD